MVRGYGSGNGNCMDRLLLRSFSLPHASFYGNWRAKVPNILPDERIYRQSGGDPGWRPWAAAFYGKRRRSSNQRAQKVRNTSATRVARLSRAAPDGAKLACLPKSSALYAISWRSASRLSLPESSSSVSPVWSKHRRQSPLFTRNAVSHRGHSSGSCVIAGSRSVKA